MKRRFSKQGLSKRRTEILLVLAIGFAGAWAISATAAEVYTWTDKDGIVHYSDIPPDNSGSEKINVDDAYRPGTSGAYPTSGESGQPPPDSGEAAAGETPQSAAQQRREQMATDRTERREAKAEMDQMCARHRQRLEQVEPARRVFYTNEKGESIRMDDDRRVALIAEDKEFIAKNCE